MVATRQAQIERHREQASGHGQASAETTEAEDRPGESCPSGKVR